LKIAEDLNHSKGQHLLTLNEGVYHEGSAELFTLINQLKPLIIPLPQN
jgi:hypothetical protein